MTGLALDHLWQSTLFALAASLTALMLRRNSAGLRFWVWFAAAVKFLLPFALIAGTAAWLAAHLHAQAPMPPRLELARKVLEPMAAHGAAQVLAPALLRRAAFDIRPYLAIAWGLGAAAVLWRRVTQWRALRQALAAASPISVPVPLPAVTAQARGGPAVVGFLRPVLVLPEGLTARLTPAELEAVMEHELHHARRLDNLLALPLLLVQALFWFHPMVWWIGRRLLSERERACDEAVLRSGADAETYARGLIEVCRLALDPAPVVAAAMGGANLKHRIRRIMTDPPPRRLGGPGRAMLAAALTAAVAVPVLAGLYTTAPLGRAPMLVALGPPVSLAAPRAAAQPERAGPIIPEPRSRSRTAAVVLLSAPAALTEFAEAALEPRPIRLARRAPAPAFQPPSVEEPQQSDNDGSADPQILRALADRTAYVEGAGLGGPALDLRAAGACPTAGVVDAERRLGGQTVSTAFDGRVRRFVEEAVTGRVGPRGLSPAMAAAVTKGLPRLQPALARFGDPGAARLIGEDRRDRDVYVVRPGGGYVLVLVDDLGQIEAALFCAAD